MGYVALILFLGACYGAYRLAKAERSWKKREGSSGSMAGFVDLQRIIEPRVEHVIKVKEKRRNDHEADETMPQAQNEKTGA